MICRPSEYVRSGEGRAMQARLWAETLETLKDYIPTTILTDL